MFLYNIVLYTFGQGHMNYGLQIIAVIFFLLHHFFGVWPLFFFFLVVH